MVDPLPTWRPWNPGFRARVRNRQDKRSAASARPSNHKTRANSRKEGVREFHCKAGLPYLRRICGSDAGELRAHVVDDVDIAVRPVVVSQPKIGTHRLSIRRVHLNQTREGQETSKGIISLQAGQQYRKIAIRERQSKSIPGLGSGERELRGRPIVGTYTKFIESSSVIAAEAFEEVV